MPFAPSPWWASNQPTYIAKAGEMQNSGAEKKMRYEILTSISLSFLVIIDRMDQNSTRK
jgi:hypothetical protein